MRDESPRITSYNVCYTKLLRAFLDSAKKVLMLGGCALCTITHGILGERAEWKECQEELGVPIHYYHRDDLTPSLKSIVNEHFPCILAQIGTQYRITSYNVCYTKLLRILSRSRV